MTDEEKNQIGLIRYGLIADLVSGVYKGSLNEFFLSKAGDITFYDGTIKKVSADTIERWYYAYKKRGFEGIKPKSRNDCGRYRKLDDEVMSIISHYVENHPRLPATAIYDELIKNGYITQDEISVSTLSRYVSRIKNKSYIIDHAEVKRYEAEHINDIWCCDTTYSFKLTVGNEKKRMFIVGIIDDASRMIVGTDVFFNDNYVNFMSVLKQAVKKYGKPKKLNLDNGAPYKNKQLDLLAARVGISLFHNKPYYGAGKAKIERWFRTMKDHFMANYNLTSKTTLEDFKRDYFEYVNTYNNSTHSSLNGKTPIERFFNSGEEVLRIDDETLDKNFLIEIKRKASIDNVIQIDNIKFEVPQKYGNKDVTLRYSNDYKSCYVVEADGTLTPITLLDKIANSKMKRAKPVFNVEETK